MNTAAFNRILYILRENRFNFTGEKELQSALEQAFTAAELEFEREVSLSKKDRIDFLFPGGLGVEVKVDGSKNNLIRQLHRYAAHERIEHLLVITNKSRLASMPGTLNEKNVHAITINRNAF